MPPIADSTQEHSDASIIKDAIYFALYPNTEATATDLFSRVTSNLPCSREDFDQFLSELVESGRITKSDSDPPIYRLVRY